MFERRRVVAFAVCAARAVVPASNTMITSRVGLECPRTWMARSAPPIGRMMVWTASQTESIQGILSAKNSSRKRTPDNHDDWLAQDCERLILWGKNDPVEMNGKASGENSQVKI